MISIAALAIISCCSMISCHGELMIESKQDYFDNRLSEVSDNPFSDHDSELNDLIKTVLEAIERCKESGQVGFAEDSTGSCSEQLESLVVDLPPDKKKVLTDIIDLALSVNNSTIERKAQKGGKKTQIEKRIEVFTVPPGQNDKIQEILRNVLDKGRTSTSETEMKQLKDIIYDKRKHGSEGNDLLQKVIDQFLEEVQKNKREPVFL